MSPDTRTPPFQLSDEAVPAGGGGRISRSDVLDQEHERQVVYGRRLESPAPVETDCSWIFGMDQYQTESGQVGHLEGFEQGSVLSSAAARPSPDAHGRRRAGPRSIAGRGSGWLRAARPVASTLATTAVADGVVPDHPRAVL